MIDGVENAVTLADPKGVKTDAVSGMLLGVDGSGERSDGDGLIPRREKSSESSSLWLGVGDGGVPSRQPLGPGSPMRGTRGVDSDSGELKVAGLSLGEAKVSGGVVGGSDGARLLVLSASSLCAMAKQETGR